jgi:galactonate dehydratase
VPGHLADLSYHDAAFQPDDLNCEELLMKITAVKAFPVRSGFRNLFVVKVETDSGIYGLGEGGISGRELAMQGMVQHYEQILIGMDPARIEHIWQTLYRGAYFEGGKISGAVISAIDIALYDILGKSLGVPVYQLLGGAARTAVQAFSSPGQLTGPEVVEETRKHVDEGWKALRFGPGMGTPGWTGEDGAIFEPYESIDLAVHWLREVRKAVGSRILLSIDYHHRLSVAEAAHFCQQVEDLHLHFVEEPIRCEDPKAYQQLRTMTNVPFAIGEEFSSKWAFAPYIEEGILNFCRIDVSNVGGLTEAKKIAGWCETHYIDLMPHNPLGPITTAASVHLGIATNNFAMLEFQHKVGASYPREMFPTMLELNVDRYPLPTAPGLGVEFNEDAIADNPFDMWEAPHWQRPDGAFTNW